MVNKPIDAVGIANINMNMFNGGYIQPNTSGLPPQWNSGGFIPNNTPIIQPTSTIGDNFKAKKAGKNGSHVILVVDESGSMHGLRSQTIDSVNEFITSQKVDAEETGIETFISVYKFDGGNVAAIINKVDVKTNPKISEDTYRPRGSTNLNDAFGSVIAQINKDLASSKKKQRPSIIMSVMTDGGENSSTTFTAVDVKKMVEKCQGSDWGFVFLGANIDAFATGQMYGFGKNNTLQYGASETGVSASLMSATRAVSSLKSDMASNGYEGISAAYAKHGFTADERAKSEGK